MYHAHLFALISPMGVEKFRIMSDRNPTLVKENTCWALIFTTSGMTFEEAHMKARVIISKTYPWMRID